MTNSGIVALSSLSMIVCPPRIALKNTLRIPHRIRIAIAYNNQVFSTSRIIYGIPYWNPRITCPLPSTQTSI